MKALGYLLVSSPLLAVFALAFIAAGWRGVLINLIVLGSAAIVMSLIFVGMKLIEWSNE